MPNLAELIPAVTGVLVFTSILIADQNDPAKRRLAWILGLTSQVLLVTFGILTHNYAFWSYLLVASAFVRNLVRRKKDDEPSG